MCRILFKYSRDERNGVEFLNALDTMKNGGPDDSGAWIESCEDGKATLYFGNRRLSILDLSDRGKQPMKSEDGNIVLIFNGEIYNYKELKKQHHLKTKSTGDTEVILRLYERIGVQALYELDGEYAILLYDKSAQRIYATTDEMGIKPLYMKRSGHGPGQDIVISSELKAIIALSGGEQTYVSRDYLADALMSGYSPDLAPLASVEKFIPGKVYEIHTNGTLTVMIHDREISFRSRLEIPLSLTTAAKKRRIRNTLERAVKKRMISDVPISLTLSGGIDSSILAYLMAKNSKKPINTYSIAIEGMTNELNKAKRVAELIGSNHTEVVVTLQEVIDHLDDIIMTMEAPSDRGSLIPTYFLAKAIKEKVTLIGEGADEVFGGYSRYTKFFEDQRIRRYGHYSVRAYALQFLGQFDELIPPRHIVTEITPTDHVYLTLNPNFDDLQNETNLVDRNYSPNWRVQKLQTIDLQNEIPGFHNLRIDKMMMRFGVEARVPFLDPEVVLLGLRLDGKDKINPPKNMLREAFRGKLPDDILDQEKIPLKFPYEELLSERTIQNDFEYGLDKGYLNPTLLQEITSLPDDARNKWRRMWAIALVCRYLRLMDQRYGIKVYD